MKMGTYREGLQSQLIAVTFYTKMLAFVSELQERLIRDIVPTIHSLTFVHFPVRAFFTFTSCSADTVWIE